MATQEPTRQETYRVTTQETDLFNVWCFALESGEFRQIRGALYGPDNGACVYGVGNIVLTRAGHYLQSVEIGAWEHLHPAITSILFHAPHLLGYESLGEANDAGESFKVIAAALRRARLDVEQGLA
jgi:hypothetical protein